MKKILKEELSRILELSHYNKGKTISEQDTKVTGIIDKIFGKKDEPKKADLVSDDVKEFYSNLEKAANEGGLSEQKRGDMTYQKGVESLQIGLILLGYELPNHGVDGLFGPETAKAVSKFKEEHLKGELKESVSVVSSGGNLIGKPNQGTHNASDWQSANAWDVAAPEGTKVYSISSGIVNNVRQGTGGLIKSGNKKIYGDQISIKSQDGKPDVFYTHIETNLNKGDKVNVGDIIGTIMKYGGIPTHVHIGLSYGNLSDYSTLKAANGGDLDSKSEGDTKATPEMINKMIELLKQKNIKSEDIKKHIDTVVTGGGAFLSDLDLSKEYGKKAYAEICQKFIDTRSSNLLGITGEMIKKGAVMAFEKYKKYIPPELAMAQLTSEGGFSKNPNARPIRTKNPFNVGNTDSGKNIYEASVQDGINRYFDLMARNYIGNGKTAADLMTNFVNKKGLRYATAPNYEKSVSTIAKQVSNIGQPIYAAYQSKINSNIA